MANKKQRREQERRRRQTRQNHPASVEAVDRRRSVVVDVEDVGGIPVAEPQALVVIEPIRLDSGDDLYFQTPFVVPFYLLKAKALRDKAEPKRKRAITSTVVTSDGTLRPKNPFGALDALEDYSLAVILAAAAVEAHANDMIGRLRDDAMVEIPTRVGGHTILISRDKAAMDRLPIAEKLHRAAPLLHETTSIKGTAAWQKFRRLVRLRNSLLHQRRVAINDPLKPSAFGRLLAGEAATAPEDAASIIEALEPGWMPKEIRREFGL